MSLVINKGIICPADEENILYQINKEYDKIKFDCDSSFFERLEFENYKRTSKQAKISEVMNENKKKLNANEVGTLLDRLYKSDNGMSSSI